MLVDDDPALISLYSRLLSERFYEVVAASTGAEAIDVLRYNNPDAVICDILLPDINGLDILRASRDIGSLTPFLMLSGGGSVRDAIEAMKLGAADVLEKPVELEELLTRIDFVLNDRPEAHAAARWARTIAVVLHAKRDPKTIDLWSRIAYASPGALRNWCRTVGIPARRSLILARLLRAAALSEHGQHRPENVLDVVDVRTLRGLLKAVGLEQHTQLNVSVNELLNLQTIVKDPDTLNELRKAITTYEAERAAGSLK